MTEEQVGRVVALTDRMTALSAEMDAEKEQIAAEIEVVAIQRDCGGFEIHTRLGDQNFKSEAAGNQRPTVAYLRNVLAVQVALHSRRMPKHLEYRALLDEMAKEVAA